MRYTYKNMNERIHNVQETSLTERFIQKPVLTYTLYSCGPGWPLYIREDTPIRGCFFHARVHSLALMALTWWHAFKLPHFSKTPNAPFVLPHTVVRFILVIWKLRTGKDVSLPIRFLKCLKCQSLADNHIDATYCDVFPAYLRSPRRASFGYMPMRIHGGTHATGRWKELAQT